MKKYKYILAISLLSLIAVVSSCNGFLDEKGFILCVPNTKDRRKKNIYLTEKAYDIRRRMEADRRKMERKLTLRMTKKEIDVLKKSLDKVLYNIAEP